MISKATESIDHMLKAFPDDAEQYPLMPRAGTRAGEAAAERLKDIVEGFVRHGQGNVLFDSHGAVLTTLTTWLTCMSSSVVRTVRHTGTLLGKGDMLARMFNTSLGGGCH